MHHLESPTPSLTISPASDPVLEPASWLIVLVPAQEADMIVVARRIWELADSGGRRVRFVGLYNEAVQELSLKRQLIHMSALVGTGGIYTETKTVFSRDYVEAVRSLWQAGDLVVCFREHRLGGSGRLLSDTLQAGLNVPVYVLSGLQPQKGTHSRPLVQFFAWSGFLGLIAGFFLIQVRIDQLTSGWIQTSLLILSIVIELWMIWVWNVLFQ